MRTTRSRLVLPSPRGPAPAAARPAPAPLTPLKLGLRSARWTDGGLELTGFVRRDDRGSGKVRSSFTVLELARPGRPPIRFRTRPIRLPEVTEDSGQSDHNHDWAAFTVTIDPERLRTDGGWPDADWEVRAGLLRTLRLTGVRREHGPLRPHWCGSGEYPPAHWVAENVRVLPYFADHRLRLKVHQVWSRLTGLRPVDGGLELTGWAHDLPPGTVFRLRDWRSGAESRHPVAATGRDFTVRLPFQAFETFEASADHDPAAGTWYWHGELLRPDGSTERPVLDDRPWPGGLVLPRPTGGALLVRQLGDGYPQFCAQPGAVLVDRIAPERDGFRLTTHAALPGEGPLELVLRHCNGTRETRHPAERGPLTELTVPAVSAGADLGRRPLRRGVWELWLRPAGRAEDEQPLLLSQRALAQLPCAVALGATAGVVAGGAKQAVLQSRWHNTLILDSTPVLAPAERSRYAQRRLRTVDYPAARRHPLRPTVLYDVFGGRGYADSPRAVHAELARRDVPLEHLWVVDDAQAVVPAGVRPVRSHSPEWYEALATSRYLVGNTHLPDFLDRRPGQVVLQTWHGSLLKRIAHDMTNPLLARAGYLAALDREVPQWSLLLSPSAFATPILRRAFRYPGEILESGYPRNDLLARGADASAVRRRLGIPDGRRVVLYAPTWREDQQRGNGDGYRLDLRLDLAAARAALGADHVLLVRPHTHVAEPLPGAGDGFVRDVGDYPDVQELLLAADVLVTDYSSIMFDFAITGRPMLFFTYDLAHYRDALRGFYFDFEREAPGPLLADSAELIGALRSLTTGTTLVDRHADAYRRFRATHCRLDDGRAAARVVDRLLELGG
ncbi:CDP-glycerol glycerophosphotransferase family protein [Kitasatospora sp. NPDC101801]|uniref:CDP-glycerol glycerophosphotransferase family protein n=1 Tax=Kitasatospora sp. NPDC101801 TaxID=3364103 RepID=UPI003811AE02